MLRFAVGEAAREAISLPCPGVSGSLAVAARTGLKPPDFCGPYTVNCDGREPFAVASSGIG